MDLYKAQLLIDLRRYSFKGRTNNAFYQQGVIYVLIVDAYFTSRAMNEYRAYDASL